MASAPERAEAPARRRLGLTPFGAGVLSLLFPGLLIALASHQVVLIAVALSAGAFLLIDAVAGVVLIDGVTVTVEPPATATAGETSPAVVRLGARRRVEVSVDVPRAAGPVAVMTPGRVELPLLVGSRAVFDRTLVRLRTAAPFGLVAVARVGDLPFPHPLHVGPPIGATDLRDRQRSAGTLNGFDESEGLRPFTRGDSPREVHWPSAARVGYLLVRDRRSVSTPERVTVVAVDDAGRGGNGAVPGMARSAVERLLASGSVVELVTAEPVEVVARRVGGSEPRPLGDEPTGARWVSGRVGTRDQLLVRLARAGTGRPPGQPPGPDRAAVVLIVDGEGARWAPPS